MVEFKYTLIFFIFNLFYYFFNHQFAFSMWYTFLVFLIEIVVISISIVLDGEVAKNQALKNLRK